MTETIDCEASFNSAPVKTLQEIIAGLTLAELKSMKTSFEGSIKEIESQTNEFYQGLKFIADELTSRCKVTFKSILDAEGKTSGELTREIEGLKLHFKLDKKVTWDGNKLAKILIDCPSLGGKIIKTKTTYNVTETAYNTIPDDKLLSALDDARTVEYCEPKVVFVEEKE